MDKKLVRVEDGRMIAGVCTGLGVYFGVDPTIIRVIFIVLSFLSFAFGAFLLYPCCGRSCPWKRRNRCRPPFSGAIPSCASPANPFLTDAIRYMVAAGVCCSCPLPERFGNCGVSPALPVARAGRSAYTLGGLRARSSDREAARSVRPDSINVMDSLHAFIPMDRRLAMARGESLPDRTQGAVLFADISGFTPLTAALAQELGVQRGAEEVLNQINPVYEALIDGAPPLWR